MDYRDIQKLKAFFSALKDSGFKPNLNQISSFTMIDGQRTPVDKTYCLGLLRRFPQFQGDKFKDDNAIIKYLSDPSNRKFLLGVLTPQQQIELTKALEEKPIVVETAGEQPSGQEEPLPAGEPPATMAGSQRIPGIPGVPRIPIIPTGPPKPEVSIKPSVPDAFTKAFENEPDYKLDPTKKPASAAKNVSGPSFQTPKPPAFLTNIGSSTGIGLKRGLAKAGSGLSGMLGGIAGGSGRFFTKVGLGTADRMVIFSNQISRGSLIKGPSKRIWLLFLGGFMLLVLGTGFIGALPGQQQQPASGIGTGGGLDYTIPFRDTSITVADPDGVKNLVRSSWPNAQLQNWDTIVNQAITNGWNPAFVLTLWIEETGAQGVPSYLDPLGCAPGQPTTDINLSLRCLFNNFPISKYPNDKFADFMCMYSESKLSPCSFVTNRFFPKNIKDWYSKLVPSGPGALVLTSPQPAITAVASCPVTGGTISTPSYEGGRASGRNNGHCDPASYTYTCNCGTSGRRAKAIDVPTNGQDVLLPKINGQDVSWTMAIAPYTVDSGEGGGVGYTFKATLGSDTWYLDVLHLQPSVLKMGENYSSDTPIAKTAISHVHMTMGKNLGVNPVAGTNTDCNPNWLSSDFMCK